MNRGTISAAALEPCMQVDKDSTDEFALLKRCVARDVGVIHCQLDDLSVAGRADEAVDDEASIVARHNLRRRGRVERGPVNDRAIQWDRLYLLTRLSITPMNAVTAIKAKYEIVFVANALVEEGLANPARRGTKSIVYRPQRRPCRVTDSGRAMASDTICLPVALY